MEAIISFGVWVGMVCSTGALFYDQLKRVNRERLKFEKSHRELIQRRIISENLRG